MNYPSKIPTKVATGLIRDLSDRLLISVDMTKVRNGHFFYGLHNCGRFREHLQKVCDFTKV